MPSPWFVAVLMTGGLLFVPAWPSVAQDLRTGVEQIAAQIVEALPAENNLRIAVADFPDLQGVTSDFGRYVANRLTTRLAQSKKVSVVERQRLGQVLAELKFNMSDLVDPAKAKQLGRMAGVEAIVVGTVSDLGNQVDVDARVIEVETSRMLLSATTTVSKDQVVTQLLERGQEASVGSSAPGTPSSSRASGASRYQEFPKFRIEVERLQVTSDGAVMLFLTYINRTQQDLLLGFCKAPSIDKTYLMDGAGDRYRYIQATGIRELCARGAEGGRKPLPINPGQRLPVSLTFRKHIEGGGLGNIFSFISEQIVVRRGEHGGHDTESTHLISIRDIEAR